MRRPLPQLSVQPHDPAATPGDPDGVLVIDCDTCAARRPEVCEDCVVTFLCERGDPGPVVLDGDEVRTLGVLHGAGLVPRLRHLAPV